MYNQKDTPWMLKLSSYIPRDLWVTFQSLNGYLTSPETQPHVAWTQWKYNIHPPKYNWTYQNDTCMQHIMCTRTETTRVDTELESLEPRYVIAQIYIPHHHLSSVQLYHTDRHLILKPTHKAPTHVDMNTLSHIKSHLIDSNEYISHCYPLP